MLKASNTKETTEDCCIRLFSEIEDEGIGDWAADAEREEAEIEAIKNKIGYDRERQEETETRRKEDTE